MVGDGPIRISVDEWVVVRNNPRFPSAFIRIIDRGGPFERYRVVSFDLDSSKRMFLGRFATLAAANDSVLFEHPEGYTSLVTQRSTLGYLPH